MKIMMAQLNPLIGDIAGNQAKLVETMSRSREAAPDLVVFPELFLVGYPPKDLLERPWFIEKVQRAIRELTEFSVRFPDVGLLFGAPLPNEKDFGKRLHNSAVLIERGRILFTQHKSLLPTYDVFDETRYFSSARAIDTVAFRGETLGISVCEDAWNSPELWPNRLPYASDPIATLAGKGATLLINISASPFFAGKEEIRYRLLRDHCRRHRLPVVFVNQVGGNDELIFDGRSLCLDPAGEPISVAPSFEEDIRLIETRAAGVPGQYVPQGRIASIHDALVLGVRDYMKKCGFSKAVVGLSGGVDSAVTCCLAAEAAGRENVLGISMPSRYSSRGSVEDSRELAGNLGVRFEVIPITAVYEAYLETLRGDFAGREPDVAEENIQARIRGNLLMAFSNKFGHLVLSTGNKSELAVGYCTLYGDMSGGLAVISDVPKMSVYELARYINRKAEVIPGAILEKPPSAELKPNQRDEDTLPPYPVLDRIIHQLIEELRSVEEIASSGLDAETVRRVARMVEMSEYKRKQAAPGLKVTTKAFGVGRRIPIAAKCDVD
jgi:NAD+ synthase (glutamine-hydrolysing)